MKTLISFELRKLFARRLTQAALLAVLLLSILFTSSTYRNMYAFDGKSRDGSGREAVEIDRSIAEKYAGILTDEKVQQMMSDFAPESSLDLHGMNAAYLYHNATQSAAFRHFSDLNGRWNGLTVSDVFGDEVIRIGYINGWLETSQNMTVIFLVLSLVIITMIAPVFSGEYSGVDQILLTTRYGRTRCAAAKVLAGILAALSVTAVVSATHFFPALLLYGSDGLRCSILFAPAGFLDGFIPFNLTCGTLFAYQILLIFTGAVSVSGITFLVSAASKSPMTALAVSAAAYLLPALLPVSETSSLFRYLTLLPVYHVQFVSLMSIEQISGGILYALWAVPVSLTFLGIGSLASSRIFAKHQVK